MRIRLMEAFIAAVVVASTSATAGNAPSGAAQPSATAAGTLTVVSATTYGPNNQVIASLKVTGTTDDGGGNDIVCGVIWDDGTVKVSQCLTVAVGATQTLTFTLNWTGPIATGAPGVGLDIYDATSAAAPTTGTVLAAIDPLFLAISSPVPTMSEWSLIAMAALVLLAGVAFLRSRGSRRPVA